MTKIPSPDDWDLLVNHLGTVKHGRIQEFKPGNISETSSEASARSAHSNPSRYKVTDKERKAVHDLDGRRCFVTKSFSCGCEVAHILANSNAGNRNLVSLPASVDSHNLANSASQVNALRGLGIVHPDFNMADISNLILSE